MALPNPLTPRDCDCTDLDGFMLNVERLMASELVAVSSHEVVAAAIFIWCRAWKQTPAASLPDDDRTNAAFAKLPLARFKKLKPEIMRGFIKCSDGRLYHTYLSKEAIRATAKKAAYRAKREADTKRLNEWRERQRETRFETSGETCFVAEETGTGTGTGTLSKKDTSQEVGTYQVEVGGRANGKSHSGIVDFDIETGEVF